MAGAKKLLMQIGRDETCQTGHHVPNASTLNSSTLNYWVGTPFCSVYGLVGCAGRTALVVRLLFMLNKTALNLSWAGAAMLGQLGHSPSRLWEYLILSSKKSSTPCRNLPNGNQAVARIETGCPTFLCASFSHS